MTCARVAGIGVASLLMNGVLFGQSPAPARQRELTTQQHTGSVYTQFGAEDHHQCGGKPNAGRRPRCHRRSSRRWPTQPQDAVSMMELQAAASRYIAQVTGAEAGYVTAGASSGLTLGTAAILAGLDLAKMERLPDTTGMKNEVIISREHGAEEGRKHLESVSEPRRSARRTAADHASIEHGIALSAVGVEHGGARLLGIGHLAGAQTGGSGRLRERGAPGSRHPGDQLVAPRPGAQPGAYTTPASSPVRRQEVMFEPTGRVTRDEAELTRGRMNMSRRVWHSWLRAIVLLVVLMWSTAGARGQSAGTANGEWPSYGGDLGHTRYAPLDQITADNFNDLEVAWRFKTDSLGPRPEYKYESTPLMVHACCIRRPDRGGRSWRSMQRRVRCDGCTASAKAPAVTPLHGSSRAAA